MTIEKFWTRVRKTETCWLWLGAKRGGMTKDSRYGGILYQGKYIYAHRFSYEISIGKIPNGLTIDHLCRNTLCVNPSHLEPVTIQENIRRRPKIIRSYDSRKWSEEMRKKISERMKGILPPQLAPHVFKKGMVATNKIGGYCRVKGCSNPYLASGKCRRHYNNEWNRLHKRVDVPVQKSR
jgi:hypothetical protein